MLASELSTGRRDRKLHEMYCNPIILACACFLAKLTLVAAADQEQPPQPRTPRDYAHPTYNSRVRDLVAFFENLNDDVAGRDRDVSQKTLVVLGLGESASKVYILSHGQPLETKCNLYVKLLSKPNIRTVATISLLMKENPTLDEMDQPDADLVAKLMAGRSFNALSRIQTIIQTLNSERSLGKSNFEPSVERELLDCVNYYLYRHQQATSGVLDYVRSSMARLPQQVVARSDSEKFLERLRDPTERILSIESEESTLAPFNYDSWVKELTRLQEIVAENEYEIPEVVRNFLADPKRAERLQLMLESDDLKDRLLAAEAAGGQQKNELITNEEYRAALSRLQEVCSRPALELKPPLETCILLEDSIRADILNEIKMEHEARESAASDVVQSSVGGADEQTLWNHQDSDSENKNGESLRPDEQELDREAPAAGQKLEITGPDDLSSDTLHASVSKPESAGLELGEAPAEPFAPPVPVVPREAAANNTWLGPSEPSNRISTTSKIDGQKLRNAMGPPSWDIGFWPYRRKTLQAKS